MNARQRLYDAIKKARTEGEAWATFGSHRLKLKPLVWIKQDCFDVPTVGGDPSCSLDGGHFDALIRSRRPGGVNIAFVDAYKDVGARLRVWEQGRRSHMIGWDDVLAVIVEKHAREAVENSRSERTKSDGP